MLYILIKSSLSACKISNDVAQNVLHHKIMCYKGS